MPALHAVIFDMDGLLIDTEPVWRRGEQTVFASVGLYLTEEQCLQTMGIRIGEIVDTYYAQHPWTGPTPAEITERIYQYVIDHVRTEGVAQPGVHAAMQVVRDAGLPIAIASSSSLRLIAAVMDRLDLNQYVQLACSADHEVEGKPHPAVYLTAARRLGVPADTCLAIEDSPNGVLSAKAAGMRCIAVPDPHLAADPRMARADLRLESLEELTQETLDRVVQLDTVAG